MKFPTYKRNLNKRELAHNLAVVALGCGLIAMAAKMAYYTISGYYVQFPLFPNMIDWALIAIGGAALIVLGVKK